MVFNLNTRLTVGDYMRILLHAIGICAIGLLIIWIALALGGSP